MKKGYLATLHGKLFVIIMSASLPIIIFTIIALSYLIHLIKHRSLEILSYKSYFAKEVAEEVLSESEEILFFIASSSAFLSEDWQSLSHITSGTLLRNDLYKNIVVQEANDQIVMQMLPFRQLTVVRPTHYLQEYPRHEQLAIGSLFYDGDRPLIPITLYLTDGRSITLLIDWTILLHKMRLENDLSYAPNAPANGYALVYTQNRLADGGSRMIAVSSEKQPTVYSSSSMQMVGIYQLNDTFKDRYLVQNQVLYSSSNAMLVLSVSQLDYRWYHNFWHIVYLLTLAFIFIAFSSTLLGYVILKQVLLKNIESILGTIKHLGKGNFVARATILEEDGLSALADGINNMAESIEREHSSLRLAAHTDVLTGVYNRRYFMEQAEVLHREYCKSSIIIFDVDHFKRFNDTYGHATGDAVLVYLAQKVAASVRSDDIFARYGGEEFILFLHATSSETAYHIAEGIRSLISDEPCRLTKEQELGLTISLGVASSEEYLYMELSELIMNADMALYQAKEQGRNRVVAFIDFSSLGSIETPDT
jgi:diguanylate cyclase (GGDEF)-like protein